MATGETTQALTLDSEQLFVFKLNTAKTITYIDASFLNFNNYRENHLLGLPIESLIHPDVPKSILRYMWDELEEDREFFIYLKYTTREGVPYWVFANATPGHATDGSLKEYFFAQRKSSEQALQVIEPIYEEMCEAENNNDGMTASIAILNQAITQLGGNYEEFILGL